MRAVGTIAAVELRRFLRDRSNIFFVFIFPLLLVLLIGLQFGGPGTSTGTVAVTGSDGQLRTELVDRLVADDVEVDVVGADAMDERLARGRVDVGLRIDEAAEQAYLAGEDVTLRMVLGSGTGAPATAQRVQTAADALSTERGQLAALAELGVEAPTAAGALETARAQVRAAEIEVVNVSEIAQAFDGVDSRFQVGAAGQVLLFVFLVSLAGATTLIQARRYRVITRTLAAPVSHGQTVLGQAAGRFVIAGFQGIYIMVATAVLFDVSWGNIGASLVVLAAFSAVAAGAAMALGSLVDNENAAVGLGVGLGLVFAALGGSMFPLELFPDTLRTISHFTPHSWAYEALAEIQRRDGGVLDVLPNLAVLVGMAAALLLLGSWLLRRSFARAM